MGARVRLFASLVPFALALAAWASPAHAQVAAHATITWTGPGTCLACHGQQARQVHASSHYQ